MAQGDVAYGFVPRAVLADLQDIGNWRSRADGIDRLHKALLDVRSPAVLLPQLPQFVVFLGSLVQDPNFKIALSSLQILGELVTKVGLSIEPHVRTIVLTLIEKFSDSKVMVRSANIKVLKQLLRVAGGKAMVAMLAGSVRHGNWSVREGAVNACTMILVQHKSECSDAQQQLFDTLAAALGDVKERVRDAALEGLAALQSVAGAGTVASMLDACSQGAAIKQMARARLRSPVLPMVSPDGIVKPAVPSGSPGEGTAALVAVPAPLGGGPGARRGVGAAGRLPWEVPPPPPPLDEHSGDGDAHVNGGSALGGTAAGRLALSRLAIVHDMPGDKGGSASTIGGVTGGRGAWPHPVPPALLLGRGPVLEALPIRGAPPLLQHQAGSARPGAPSYSDRRERPPPANDKGAKDGVAGSKDGVSGGGKGRMELMFGGMGGLGGLSSGSSGAGSKPLASPPPLQQHSPSPSSRPTAGAAARDSGAVSASNHRTDESVDTSPTTPSGTYQSIFTSGGGRVEGERASASARTSQPSHAQQQQWDGSGEGSGGGRGGYAPSLHTAYDIDPVGSPGPLSADMNSPSKVRLLANLKRRQEEKRAISAQLPERPHGAPLGSRTAAEQQQQATSSTRFDSGLLSSAPTLLKALPAHATALRLSMDTNSAMPFDQFARLNNGGNGSGGLPPQYMSTHPPSSVPAGGRLGTRSSAPTEPSTSSSIPRRKGPPSPPRAPHSAGPSYDDDAYQHGNGVGYAPLSSAGSRSAGQRTLLQYAEPATGLRRSAGSPARQHRSGPCAVASSGNAPDSPSTYERASSLVQDKPSGVELSHADLMPLSDVPERALRSTLATLVTANNTGRKELDWQGQYEALNDVRRLTKYHPDLIRGNLHEIVVALAPALDALRSQTSRNAMVLLQEMFVTVGRALDRELEEVIPILLKRASEVSTAGRENFLTTEADKTLADMARCVSEVRAVSALISNAGHKNPVLRQKVASNLDSVVEGGVSVGLQGSWGCLEKLLKATSGFLNEGALETRTHGKRIVWSLKQGIGRAEFERLVATLPPANQQKVIDILDSMNGPPPPPGRNVGARLGPSGTGPRSYASPMRTHHSAPVGAHSIGAGGAGADMGGPSPPPGSRCRDFRLREDGGANIPPAAPAPAHSRGQALVPTSDARSGARLLQRNDSSGNGRAAADAPLRRGVVSAQHKNDAPERGYAAMAAGGGGGVPSPLAGGAGFSVDAQDSLSRAMAQLGAKDFREKIQGLKSVDAIAGSLVAAPDTVLMGLLDSVTMRLGDGNSKVNVQALETLGRLFERLRNRVAVCLNTLVPALAANLGSANEKTRLVAATACDKLVTSVQPALLVQNFSHCVSNGSARGRAMMAERLEGIIVALYPTRPQLVVKYAVPAAMSLVNDTKGGTEVKAAANVLLTALARAMGPGLMDHTASMSPALQQRVADAVQSVEYY
ncbi:hypothetical protein FOA52_008743 [Chlamydomonas sp. UWO 241]|nr:hypothetical protein FOA52_008743 [Chlamydomonas sp. UWO 241]